VVQGLLARSFFGTPTRRKITLSFAFSPRPYKVCLCRQRSLIFTPCSRKSTVSCFDIGCPYRPVLCSDPTRLDEPSACVDSSTEMCRHLQRILLHGPPVGYSGKRGQQKRRQHTRQESTRKSRHRCRWAEDIIPHLRTPYTTCSHWRQPHQTRGMLRVRHARQPTCVCRARDAKVTSNSDRKATATAYPPPLPLLPFFSPVPFSACAGTRSPAATHPTAAWWTTTTSPSTDSCELKPNRSL